MRLGMSKGLWYIPPSLKPRHDPVGAFGIQSGPSGYHRLTIGVEVDPGNTPS
jgi:hypothetical protein